MMHFALHPEVYSTDRRLVGLRSMLEKTWVHTHRPGDGTLYLISGFANFNGGARFYRPFKEHTEAGGRLVAFLGGSTRQNLSSRQVVDALLGCGAEVTIVNRKRLLHAKCYGKVSAGGQSLVVTSGNFTGPGMSQNVEAALLVEGAALAQMGFDWTVLEQRLRAQQWMTFDPARAAPNDPRWQLLYDETPGRVGLDETEAVTLVLVLGHADTARIQATPGTSADKGTQYFWLSKDSFDFFPPLTIRNERGYKGTLSALVTMRYVDLGVVDNTCRVTFEAENNLDFRLGTGRLRNTRIAASGDLACVTRVGEADYQLRIIRRGSADFAPLEQYAINHIGHKGKRYGYIDNGDFTRLTGIQLN